MILALIAIFWVIAFSMNTSFTDADGGLRYNCTISEVGSKGHQQWEIKTKDASACEQRM
jgi:hypothetical protein